MKESKYMKKKMQANRRHQLLWSLFTKLSCSKSFKGLKLTMQLNHWLPFVALLVWIFFFFLFNTFADANVYAEQRFLRIIEWVCSNLRSLLISAMCYWTQYLFPKTDTKKRLLQNIAVDHLSRKYTDFYQFLY